MLNFFIGFAFFEFGALCGFFVAALMQAARDGGEIAGRSRTENIQYCSVYYKADSPNDSECRKNCYSAVSGKDGWWQRTLVKRGGWPRAKSWANTSCL